jgi:superfamily II DNA or RNA helicase
LSSLLKLRDYQSGAIEALNAKFAEGMRRAAVVLPTGGGKTVVFSHLSNGYVTRNPGKRVLILAHTDELVRQAAKKMKAVAPGLSVGIVKGQIRQTKADVIVASVQSLRLEHKRNQIKGVGLVIVDECHHATATTYMAILRHYGCLDEDGEPRALAAGFTATLMRSDKTSLAKVWEAVAYKKDIPFMIRSGYLIPPIGKQVVVKDLDLDNVKKVKGDFQSKDLGDALETSFAPETVAEAYAEHAADRSGILFAPTVNSAYAFAEELNLKGIKTEVVHGKLETKERRAILERLENGETQVVSNCMVLTEGFDCPRVSCVVIARPTKSSPLYQQMVGRGLRPDHTQPLEGQDCLILDVVGISGRHSLASLVDLSIPEDDDCPEGEDCEEEELEDEEEKEETEPVAGPVELYYGKTSALDFDLLAASTRVWMKTKGGIHFLSAGLKDGVYIFVIPATEADAEPGTYDVVWCTKNANNAINGKRGGLTNHRGVSQEIAFAWGEDIAQEMGGDAGAVTLDKSRRWRTEKPSQSQVDTCKRYKIAIPAGASKGDVSTLMDQHFASSRIDSIARWFANGNTM